MKRLVLVSILVLITSGGRGASSDGLSAEAQRFETVVIAVAKFQAGEYLTGREQLVAFATNSPGIFDQVRSQSSNSQVRLLCEIVHERIERPPDIKQILADLPTLRYDRAPSRRAKIIADFLAKHCGDNPMFIVEAFWKSNELSDVTFFRQHISPLRYLARTIGVLHIDKARELLEEALSDQFYADRHYECWLDDDAKKSDVLVAQGESAVALGDIGDPRSIPSLLTMIRTCTVSRPYRIEKELALGAVEKCLDESALPVLRDCLQSLNEEERKEHLGSWLKAVIDEASKKRRGT